MVRKLFRYTGRRYLIALFGPLMVGSILLYLIGPIMGLSIDTHSNVVELLLYSSQEPFIVFMPTVFIIIFMLLGVQSIMYSILMEYIVLPYVRSKYKVMMLSASLCLLFPFFGFISLAKPGDPSYLIHSSFYMASALAGIITGYLLYRLYKFDRQYVQWLLIKQEINNKNKS